MMRTHRCEVTIACIQGAIQGRLWSDEFFEPLWQELDRYERTSPADPFALIVRCGAARRLALAGAEVVCRAASVRAPTVDARALAAKAAALHP